MRQVWISNTFSLNMISGSLDLRINTKELNLSQAKEFAKNAKSAVGHAETAKLFSDHLEIPVAFNRVTLVLSPQDCLLVGQYIGERLPEYQERRPDYAELRWVLIEYVRNGDSR
jgi:hypothetical protein